MGLSEQFLLFVSYIDEYIVSIAVVVSVCRLDIVDDSRKHAGHGGFRGSASYSGETHFIVEVVSSKFEGLTSIKRHRLVYQILDDEMGNPIHALSLVTKTPGEAGAA